MKKMLMTILVTIFLTACGSTDLEPSEQNGGSAESSVNELANVNVRGTITALNGGEVTIEVEMASPVGQRETLELESDSLTLDVTGVSIVRVTRGAAGVTEEEVNVNELSTGDTVFITFSADGTIESISLM